jgi:hypothetical protein
MRGLLMQRDEFDIVVNDAERLGTHGNAVNAI